MTDEPERPAPGCGPGDDADPRDATPELSQAQLLAAETLELVAWILTPDEAYTPVATPVPELLRALACRLQRSQPGSGPALCRRVYEIASAAESFVLTVRYAADPDAHLVSPLDATSVLTRLETVPRADLPDALLTAARLCRWPLDQTARAPWAADH
jgi:hypothetical protein